MINHQLHLLFSQRKLPVTNHRPIQVVCQATHPQIFRAVFRHTYPLPLLLRTRPGLLQVIQVSRLAFFPRLFPRFILVLFQASLLPRHRHQSPQSRHQVHQVLILLPLLALPQVLAPQVLFLAAYLPRHHRPIHLRALPSHHLFTQVPYQALLHRIVHRDFHPSSRASRRSPVNFLVRAHQ